MGLFVDPIISGLQRVLDLRLEQHTLTATNLANANTPGFHARVLDLSRELPDAMAHAALGGAPTEPEVIEIAPAPWALDGNSVLPEREMSRLSGNAMLYGAVSSGLGKHLAILRYAASDGKS